jgi:hypothetical protein
LVLAQRPDVLSVGSFYLGRKLRDCVNLGKWF